MNGGEPAGDENEGRIYAALKRAMVAPQGIGILNSTGQVLLWTQVFDDEKKILEFLDAGIARFKEFPDAAKPVAACRYMRFPGHKMEDVTDDGKAVPAVDHHPDGKRCPAAGGKSRPTKGSLSLQLFGRALDDSGDLCSDTTHQERYAQDQFLISRDAQKQLVQALSKEGKVRIPQEIAETIAEHAFLGHIDVGPFSVPGRNKGEWKRCEFWAQPHQNGSVWKIEGRSEMIGELNATGPGAHEVKLTWEGYFEIKDRRISRFLLYGSGTEKLKYGTKEMYEKFHGNEVASLMAGRFIDMDCGVRYGVLGEPVADNQAGTEEEMNEPGQAIRSKMEKLQKAVERRQKAGKDMGPVGRILEKFEPLMKAQKLKEAEAVIDEALRFLSKDE